MPTEVFRVLFLSIFITFFASLGAAQPQARATQPERPASYGGDSGFYIVSKGERSPLYKTLVVDELAEENETKWYININPEQLIELRAEPDTRKGDNGIVHEEKFVLVSKHPGIISVVNDKLLLATGRRGEAIIEVERWVRNRREADIENGIDTAPWNKIGNVNFSLGNGLTPQRKLRFRINSATDRQIISVPRLKTYKAVRDSYGKGIARNFVVVAVDINNSNAGKQFLVQNVYVSFDPTQCENFADFWATAIGDSFEYKDRSKRIKPAATPVPEKMTPEERKNECLNAYISYFGFPTSILPTDSNTMLAIAEAEKYRSSRYRLFQGLKFAADVGSALGPAFNIIGPAGRTGFSFLGGTLSSGLDTALPKISDQKLNNLRTDVPKANVIVKGNSVETINIFIPATHILSHEAWKAYRSDYKDDDYNKNKNFIKYMLLFLVAKSDGILIDENSRQVETKQGGGVPFRNL